MFFAANSSNIPFLLGVKAWDTYTSRVVAQNRAKAAARKKKLALLKEAKKLQDSKNKQKKAPVRVVQPVKKVLVEEEVLDDYDDFDVPTDAEYEYVPLQKKSRVQEEVEPTYVDDYRDDSAVGSDDGYEY